MGQTTLWVFLLWPVWISLSCGGESSPNQNSNNANDNENSTNQNDNANSCPSDEFSLELLGVPAETIPDGQTVTLTASVCNAAGDITYSWTLEPAGDASLDRSDSATVHFVGYFEGDFIISVTITDSATGQSLSDSGDITVGETGPPVGSD